MRVRHESVAGDGILNSSGTGSLEYKKKRKGYEDLAKHLPKALAADSDTSLTIRFRFILVA